jgi:hypothetical protein
MNVGASTDPANLKATFGARIQNCDLLTYDPVLGRMLRCDWHFDCRTSWPFPADDAEMVVLGDILEHLREPSQLACLREAHRVAPWLCVTVPNDPRPPEAQGPRLADFPGLYHQTVVSEALLAWWLEETRFQVVEWQTVDYGFVPEGYFVLAKRQEGVA